MNTRLTCSDNDNPVTSLDLVSLDPFFVYFGSCGFQVGKGLAPYRLSKELSSVEEKNRKSYDVHLSPDT